MGPLADKFKAMGNSCMKNQDFSTAVAHYRHGLDVDPDNPVLNCNLAQAHLNLKEYVEAENCAIKAIKHQENYTKAYFRAAKAALGRHNLYEAMLYLAHGVEKCSDENIEELYSMGKELSSEFEKHLRTFRNHKPVVKAGTSLEKGQSSKQDTKKNPASDGVKNVKLKSNTGKNVSAPQVLKTGTESVLASSETERRLKTENEELKCELSKLKKQVKNTKEDRMAEPDVNKDKKGSDFRDEERKILEKKGKEMKEREKAEALRKKEEEERERKDSERKERERKEQEKKEQEKKEKKDREKLKQLEKERKLFLEKEVERKKKIEEERKLKIKAEEEQKLKMKAEAEQKLKIKAEEEKNAALKIEVQSHMKEGSLALLKGLNRKAVDHLKKANDIIFSHLPPEILGFSNPMDHVVLQFALCQALVLSDEYNYIVKAIHIVEKLEKEGRHSKLPAVFLLLGRAYSRLNRFKNALPPLQRGLSLLNRGTSFSRYSWPGTSDVIELTDRNILKDAILRDIQMCKLYHKPDAVCFYEKCLDMSQHISPSRNIFFSDPDFIGFVAILCQERCHIYFHIPCWKDFKENLSDIEKFGEKDFLGRPCLTPDCKVTNNSHLLSHIVKVSIIGQDGEVKSSCESAPPRLPSPPLLNKEREAICKSPKKKQRKKESDKNEHFISKRTRQDSRSQGDIDQSPSNFSDLQGSEFKDALSKLATAREINFGYDHKAPDPHQITSIPQLPQLGKNEEFIYSYFLEIFKEEGYMSVFKLQEHWEANKELLPVLQPALITHTDLVKFLLDTEGFAVVQDMIGIASELPKISAIVESKVEAPQPVVFGWQPSSATALEASKTLSFTYSVSSNPGISEQDDEHGGDLSSNGNELLSSLSDKTNADRASDLINNPFRQVLSQTCEVVELKCNETAGDLECVNDPSNMSVVNSKRLNQNTSFEAISDNLPSQLHTITGDLEISSSLEMKKCIDVSDSERLNSNSTVENINCANKVSHDRVTNKNKAELPAVSSSQCLQPQQSEVEFKTATSSYPGNSKPGLFSPTSEQSEQINGISVSKFNGHSETLINGDKGPIKTLSEKKIAWKPRAKLIEWASETFPHVSKLKLWDALTSVRASNNYTLSGLSFDVIAERVRGVLEMKDGEF